MYFTGGATAVLLAWRPTTIDIRLKLVPERDALLRAIPELKETPRVNVELASPADFIPVPAGWEDRSRFVRTVGPITYCHFDLYSQALAKAERGHTQDLADVRAMVERNLIEPARALEFFRAIRRQGPARFGRRTARWSGATRSGRRPLEWPAPPAA